MRHHVKSLNVNPKLVYAEFLATIVQLGSN